jgi:predicted nucleotidyltransferase
MMVKKIPEISEVKEAILSLGEKLNEVEAIGIMGSLARGDFDEKSDIDVFVVVKEKIPGTDVERAWWERINDVLSKFKRDVTVILYSVKGLKRISNWYVLRLASEGVLLYDRGGIKDLFKKIVETARRAGLEEREAGGKRKIWVAKNLKLRERLILEVDD